MNIWFLVLTLVFIVLALAMILIILAQRPSGGGLAGAFGGAGAGGADTVFGGRVGDALTWVTVCCFLGYLGLAIGLNVIDSDAAEPMAEPASLSTPEDAQGAESGEAGFGDDSFMQSPSNVSQPQPEPGSGVSFGTESGFSGTRQPSQEMLERLEEKRKAEESGGSGGGDPESNSDAGQPE